MSLHDKIMNIPPADGSVSFILGFNSGKTLAAKLAADADTRIAALEALLKEAAVWVPGDYEISASLKNRIYTALATQPGEVK
jgi:hypothetical protein